MYESFLSPLFEFKKYVLLLFLPTERFEGFLCIIYWSQIKPSSLIGTTERAFNNIIYFLSIETSDEHSELIVSE